MALDMARIGKTEQDSEFENEYLINLLKEVANL
jgi:hypothetical protein